MVESKAISDLPLNGRNFTQLMVLMAGSTERASGTVAGHYAERAGGIAFSVNGQRQSANAFLIDGFMAKDVQHGTNSIEPIIDALHEFRVQSTNYTAEFGSEAGGQINAALKSGTNEFHGTAWEFLRNDKLDANNFFNNRTATARAPFHRNQFGVAAGGPVILPKYNGRNHTFIFGAYEGTRVVKGITQLSTVPSAALRAGDFNGTGVVTDPLTGSPFPGNTIPANRLNPITTAILDSYVPLPNRTGVFNWVSTDPQTIGVEQYNWRIDHRISDNDSVFGHYLFEDTDFHYPRLFPTDGASQKLRGQNVTGFLDAPGGSPHRKRIARGIQSLHPARIPGARRQTERGARTRDERTVRRSRLLGRTADERHRVRFLWRARRPECLRAAGLARGSIRGAGQLLSLHRTTQPARRRHYPPSSRQFSRGH